MKDYSEALGFYCRQCLTILGEKQTEKMKLHGKSYSKGLRQGICFFYGKSESQFTEDLRNARLFNPLSGEEKEISPETFEKIKNME